MGSMLTMNTATIAHTILQQLGGQHFVAMTGARALMHSPHSLAFQLPARFAVDGIDRVKVTLRPDDTYNVTFGKWKPRELRIAVVREDSNVPAESLRAIFTRRTGLQVVL